MMDEQHDIITTMREDSTMSRTRIADEVTHLGPVVADVRWKEKAQRLAALTHRSYSEVLREAFRLGLREMIADYKAGPRAVDETDNEDAA